MEFGIGDSVVYGGNGVCKITEIKDMSFFNEAPKKYYVLEPMYVKNASTMYVPLDNEVMVSKMQNVINRDEAMKLIMLLSDCKTEWIEDRNARKNAFNSTIARGSREEIMRVIKTILNHQSEITKEGKRLNMQDEKALNDAMNRINCEFAVALDMKPEEVPDFVRATAYA